MDIKKEEMLQIFLEITNEEDENKAKILLEDCQWNIEIAISTYLAKKEAVAEDQIVAEDRVNRKNHLNNHSNNKIRKRDRSVKERKSSKLGITTTPASASVTSSVSSKDKKIEKNNFSYVLNPISNILFPMFKNICCAISTVFKLISTFLLAPTNSSDFISVYENKYGNNYVRFFKGTLSEAIAKSRREEKLLLLYLHIEGQESSYFCDTVFSNQELKSFLDENCIMYAHNVSKGELKDLHNVLNIFVLPQISVLLTCYVQELRELTIVYGKPSINHIIDVVTNSIEQMQVQKDTRELMKQKTYYDRKIREEQDREYQEAVLKDMEKGQKQREIENLKEEKKKQKKEIKRKRKEKAETFKLQINPGNMTTKICLRFANGKRIQNEFSVEHTIENIYEWVECSEYMESNIEVPYKFQLICGHSKTCLQRSDEQIKQYDLFPNAVLNVKSLDTSDEE